MSSSQQSQLSPPNRLFYRECVTELSMQTLNEYFNENLYDNFGICMAEIRRTQYNSIISSGELKTYDYFYINREILESLIKGKKDKHTKLLKKISKKANTVASILNYKKKLEYFHKQISNSDTANEVFLIAHRKESSDKESSNKESSDEEKSDYDYFIVISKAFIIYYNEDEFFFYCLDESKGNTTLKYLKFKKLASAEKAKEIKDYTVEYCEDMAQKGPKSDSSFSEVKIVKITQEDAIKNERLYENDDINKNDIKEESDLKASLAMREESTKEVQYFFTEKSKEQEKPTIVHLVKFNENEKPTIESYEYKTQDVSPQLDIKQGNRNVVQSNAFYFIGKKNEAFENSTVKWDINTNIELSDDNENTLQKEFSKKLRKTPLRSISTFFLSLYSVPIIEKVKPEILKFKFQKNIFSSTPEDAKQIEDFLKKQFNSAGVKQKDVMASSDDNIENRSFARLVVNCLNPKVICKDNVEYCQTISKPPFSDVQNLTDFDKILLPYLNNYIIQVSKVKQNVTFQNKFYPIINHSEFKFHDNDEDCQMLKKRSEIYFDGVSSNYISFLSMAHKWYLKNLNPFQQRFVIMKYACLKLFVDRRVEKTELLNDLGLDDNHPCVTDFDNFYKWIFLKEKKFIPFILFAGTHFENDDFKKLLNDNKMDFDETKKDDMRWFNYYIELKNKTKWYDLYGKFKNYVKKEKPFFQFRLDFPLSSKQYILHNTFENTILKNFFDNYGGLFILNDKNNFEHIQNFVRSETKIYYLVVKKNKKTLTSSQHIYAHDKTHNFYISTNSDDTQDIEFELLFGIMQISKTTYKFVFKRENSNEWKDANNESKADKVLSYIKDNKDKKDIFPELKWSERKNLPSELSKDQKKDNVKDNIEKCDLFDKLLKKLVLSTKEVKENLDDTVLLYGVHPDLNKDTVSKTIELKLNEKFRLGKLHDVMSCYTSANLVGNDSITIKLEILPSDLQIKKRELQQEKEDEDEDEDENVDIDSVNLKIKMNNTDYTYKLYLSEDQTNDSNDRVSYIIEGMILSSIGSSLTKKTRKRKKRGKEKKSPNKIKKSRSSSKKTSGIIII